MKNTIYFTLLLSLCTWLSCQNSSQTNPRDQADFAKIDLHSHYRSDRVFLQPLLEHWNMKTVLVEVSKDDSTGQHSYWNEIQSHRDRYPQRFYLCGGFNGHGIDDPLFVERTIQELQTQIDQGAVMIKVWKNFGMVDKDSSGKYIQIDDPRLQPVWDFLAEQNLPVLAHIGEPLQAWRPLQEGNPHYNYYSNNPQYHAYKHPEIPSYETIIQARDNWLANNPKLTIIGAHMGSMSHDVDMVAERLDKYPNFYVEPAARFGDLTGQDSEKVRAFMIKYQDRIMYGTDLSTSGLAADETPEQTENRRKFIERLIELHWEYFSGVDSLYYDSPMISFPVQTRSLNLSNDVLRKIYAQNAERILGI